MQVKWEEVKPFQVLPYEEIDPQVRYIKVNISADADSLKSGNGEGCFAIVSEENWLKANDDNAAGEFLFVLANDSIYYPGLVAGTVLEAEFRGEFRPVITKKTYDALQEKRYAS